MRPHKIGKVYSPASNVPPSDCTCNKEENMYSCEIGTSEEDISIFNG